HKSARIASNATSPNCHQKFGTVMMPKQLQLFGASCDQASAPPIIRSTAGAQAPSASTGHTFFQFTAHSHQAIHAISKSDATMRATRGASSLPKSTPICIKMSSCSDMDLLNFAGACKECLWRNDS